MYARFLFTALALGPMERAQAAPPPASLYDHLPSHSVCNENVNLGLTWEAALLREAGALGYYTNTQETHPFPGGGVWCDDKHSWHGGGWHAEQIRAELHEVQQLQNIWRLARDLRATGTDDRAETELKLRGLIGHADFALGRLPPPVPWWRVTR